MKREKLISLSQRVGSRVPQWTQGSGSNLSVKEGDTLWIKGSGKRLDSIVKLTDLAKVSIASATQVLKTGSHSEQSYSDILNLVTDKTFARASMETGFHLFLPSTWVLHFHSLGAILLADDLRRDIRYWERWLETITDLSFAVLPPVLPGWSLSQKILREVEPKRIEVVLLRCHGLILQGEDPEALLEEWDKIETAYLHERGNFFTNLMGYQNEPWSGPAKFYFPDAAVFWERTRQCLEPISNGYQLKPKAWNIDRDAVEIWMATQLLYRANSDLEELDGEYTESVKVLPTELIRRNVMF